MNQYQQVHDVHALLPLSRFRVLELTLARAGPTAGRHLVDWGAEVIRVEAPRALASAEDYTGKRFGADRLNLHRGKKSVTLNLKDPEGHAAFMKLVETADVIIENMRANVKHKLGIDYESVKKINPRIVYGSISGFGQTGPYSTRAGVDQIIQGMSGLMSITGIPGHGPARVGIPLVDLAAGGYLAQGILVALLERERTGEGRWVHTSLLETMLFLLDFQAVRYLKDGFVAQQEGNNHPAYIPTGLFPTADGQVLIAAAGDRLWGRFCAAIGAPEWREDSKYLSGADRLKNRDELNHAIAERTRQKTSREWFDIFSDAAVPCGPVNTIDKTFEDEQVGHLNMVLDYVHPALGALKFMAQPYNLEGHRKTVRTMYTELGENTEEVLASLGYDRDHIQSMSDRDIV